MVIQYKYIKLNIVVLKLEEEMMGKHHLLNIKSVGKPFRFMSFKN